MYHTITAAMSYCLDGCSHSHDPVPHLCPVLDLPVCVGSYARWPLRRYTPVQGLVVPNEGEVEGSIVMVHPYLDSPGGVLARHTTDRDRSQGSTHRLDVHSNHLGRMHA